MYTQYPHVIHTITTHNKCTHALHTKHVHIIYKTKHYKHINTYEKLHTHHTFKKTQRLYTNNTHTQYNITSSMQLNLPYI